MLRKALIFLILFTFTVLFSQHNTDSKKLSDAAFKAWEENDHNKIIELFEKSLESDATNMEAAWGLIITLLTEKRFDRASEVYIAIQKNRPDLLGTNLLLNDIITLGNDLDNRGSFASRYYRKIHKATTNEVKLLTLPKIIEYYIKEEKLSKVEKYSRKQGKISNWSYIGPFENLYGSAFEEKLQAEKSHNVNEVIKGKFNLNTKWKTLDHSLTTKSLKTRDFFDFNDCASIYTVYLRSDGIKKYTLNIQGSGMLSAQLNDVVFHERIESDSKINAPNFYETTLNNGWNKLVVKSGYSELPGSDFIIEVLDETGNPIDDIDISTSRKNYQTNVLNITDIKSSLELWVDTNLENHTNDFFFNILKAQLYFTDNKYSDALKHCLISDKIYPNNGLTKAYLNLYYTTDEQIENADKYFEKTWNLDKSNVNVLEIKFNKELSRQNFDKAKEYLDDIEQIHSKSNFWWSCNVLYHIFKNSSALTDVIDEYYLHYPESKEAVSFKLQLALKEKDNYEIKRFGKKITKLSPTGLVYASLGAYYLGTGDLLNFQNFASYALDLEPYSTALAYDIANIYKEIKMYKEAQSIVNLALEKCPTNSDLLLLKADIILSENEIDSFAKTSEPIANLVRKLMNKAIRYNPLLFDSRRKLRDLEGQKSLYSINKVENLEEIRNTKNVQDLYPEEDAVYLLVDKKIVCYKNGGSEEFGEILVQILTDSGAKKFQELTITSDTDGSYVEIDEAEVYKKNGAILKAEKSQSNLVFKQLEQGDQIYIKFRDKAINYGRLRNHFYTTLFIDEQEPIKEFNFSIFVPEALTLQYNVVNFKNDPIITYFDDQTKYSWKLENIEPIEKESRMPDYRSFAKQIEMTTIPNWNFIVDWYNDVSKYSIKITPEIEQVVHTLFAGKENLSDEDKVKLIYDYITQEINYSSVSFRQSGYIPQKANRVLLSKIGDCKDVAALAVTMGKIAGLDLHIVLVNTDSENPIRKYLPSPNAFTHAIAGVELNGEKLYMDLTSDKVHFGVMPNMDADSFSLAIKPANNETFNLPKIQRHEAISHIDSELNIDENLNIIRSYNGLFKGNNAVSLRAKYEEKPKDKQNKIFKESLAYTFDNIKINQLNFTNLDANTDSLKVNASLEIDGYIKKTGKFLMLGIPWYNKLYKMKSINYNERKYPIAYWSTYNTITEETKINIPDNVKVLELPETKSINSKYFDYYVKYSNNGKKIVAERLLKIKKLWITTAEYNEFKQKFIEAQNLDEQQILMQKI